MPGIWRDFQEDLQLPHGKWSSKVKEHAIFQWRFERILYVIYAVEEFEGRWVLTAKMLWVIFLDIYRHAFVQYLTHAYCPSCPTMQYKWSLVLPPSSILHWSFWSWTMHMLSVNIRRPDTPQNFSKYLMLYFLAWSAIVTIACTLHYSFWPISDACFLAEHIFLRLGSKKWHGSLALRSICQSVIPVVYQLNKEVTSCVQTIVLSLQVMFHLYSHGDKTLNCWWGGQLHKHRTAKKDEMKIQGRLLGCNSFELAAGYDIEIRSGTNSQPQQYSTTIPYKSMSTK